MCAFPMCIWFDWQEEIYRLRAQKLKDKEKCILEDKEKLDREKLSLIRDLKRLQDQNRCNILAFVMFPRPSQLRS